MAPHIIQVYKIYFDDSPNIYIGSTKTTLSRRMTQHRTAVRRGSKYKVHNFIRSKNMDFNYVLVTSCICHNRDQQRQFEQSVIDELKPSLNSLRAYTTLEQHTQQRKESDSEYYIKNKQQILEKAKIKIRCSYCDSKIRQSDISTHKKK